MAALLTERLSPLFGLNEDTRKAAQPKSAWSYVRKGQDLSNAKKNEEALEAFQQATALDPSIPEAWMGQTGVLDKMNRKEEAWAVWDKWIAAQPDYAVPLVYKGMIAAQTGRQAEALKAFEKLTELRPTEPWWAGRAEMLNYLKRKDEALAVLDEAVVKAPKHEEVWRGRGWLLIEKKKYDEAVKNYSGAVENLPEKAEFWHGRGRCYAQLGETAKALADLKQALTLNPGLRGAIAKDALLKPLQDNEEFKALVQAK
jgi:tetratricopeptide (TPR) repeat protein